MNITRAVGDPIRLHDLPKTTPPLLDLYESQMENITQILLGSGAKHVLYALTTPFEADHAPGCRVCRLYFHGFATHWTELAVDRIRMPGPASR